MIFFPTDTTTTTQAPALRPAPTGDPRFPVGVINGTTRKLAPAPVPLRRTRAMVHPAEAALANGEMVWVDDMLVPACEQS